MSTFIEVNLKIEAFIVCMIIWQVLNESVFWGSRHDKTTPFLIMFT